jgi:nucleotide-binding universal stress UspA family protein
MFKRILVPLDGSRLSARALPYATEIARRFDAVVILMRIKQPDTIGSPLAVPSGGNPQVAAMLVDVTHEQNLKKLSSANRYINKHLRKLRSEGVKGYKKVVLGDPATAILEFCREVDIDLVIMSTRGRSGIKRAVMGSVTDRIVRDPCSPVLVVRL